MSEADLFGADRLPWSELSGADKLEQLSFGIRVICNGSITLKIRIFSWIPPLDLHRHPITSVRNLKESPTVHLSVQWWSTMLCF